MYPKVRLLFFKYDYKRIKSLSDRLIKKLCSALPYVIRNGDPEQSYPGKLIAFCSILTCRNYLNS